MVLLDWRWDVAAAPALALLLALGAGGCDPGGGPRPGLGSAQTLQPLGEVVYAASNQVRALDAQTGRELGQVKLGRLVRDMRFTPDGLRAFVGTSDGTWILDAVEHKALTRFGQGPVGAILR